MSTRTGVIWASGGDGDGRPAIARFDDERWTRYTLPEALRSQSRRGSFITSHVAADGSLWYNIWNGGVFRFDPDYPGESVDGAWTRISPGLGLWGFGQTPDGVMWGGGLGGLYRFEGNNAVRVDEPEGLTESWVNEVYSAPSGDLWVGHRRFGAYQYDGVSWTHHNTRSGLVDDNISAIVELPDGSILVSTAEGMSRFDGVTWTKRAFDPVLNPRELHRSEDGTIWMIFRDRRARTVRYVPDLEPPDVEITLSLDEVSQPGNTTLAWVARDPWEETSTDQLQFSHRLDRGQWSPFAYAQNEAFQSLESGPHTFEVRARDSDFNVDPTPAVASFIVIPPVWQQGWFIGLVIVFVGGISFQTTRVIRRDRRLRQSNQALSDANNELFQVNVDLQREQVLERLRGQAQGMQSSEDIGPVVEAVYRELSGLGLNLIHSGISIHLSESESEIWATTEAGRALEPYLRQRPALEDSPPLQARLRGEDYHHTHTEGEELKSWLRDGISRGAPEESLRLDEWPKICDSYVIYFDRGNVIVASSEPIAHEYLMLIKRFGEVFGYAHSRYKELQEKEAQNRRLAVDASVQRLRAEVQSMDEASDFERILSLLTESLKTVELAFDGCEIDVLDEPIENPTMELFEANGFRYTTFRLDPDGNVATNSYNLAAPFPSVNERTIERFIAGEPWQGHQ